MDKDSEETKWLRETFQDDTAAYSWADIRPLRKKAKLTRGLVHGAIRELEFEGFLVCDRTAADSNAWIWRRKATRSDTPPRQKDEGDQLSDAKRIELIELLDMARRITHPDVSKADNANAVTTKLNAMIDSLKSGL